jgi:hypothetical protein
MIFIKSDLAAIFSTTLFVLSEEQSFTIIISKGKTDCFNKDSIAR